jgi:hypothetical protein
LIFNNTRIFRIHKHIGGFEMTILALHRYINPVQTIMIVFGMAVITLTACEGTGPPPTLAPSVEEETAPPAPSPEAPLPPPCWQMEPSQWQTPSTRWADIGETSTLCENDPSQNYGKAESEIIVVDVDACPLLYVNAAAVDPESRYIIQLLDKSTDEATNVLTQAKAGSHIVNLTEELEWTGEKQFTLNIWIEGESKCTTFENIAIRSNNTSLERK